MTTESEVLAILRDPYHRKWTIQGFGMLRLYLADDEVERLHIWDQSMSVEDVSTVHDHPWDLTSRIISGRMGNQRYVRDLVGDQWNAVRIRTGEGGHVLADPEHWLLRPLETEVYEPGESYHQDAPEIHESLPTPGTVTVVERTFSRKRDVATSCYRDTPDWVSAEPRPATVLEIEHFVRLALDQWET